MITTTELLDFLNKAHFLSHHNVLLHHLSEEGYRIEIFCDWDDDGDVHHQSVVITNEGESTWDKGDHDFYTMNNILDEMYEREEQKKIKAQKRKELIESLTPEQRELLGCDS